MSDTEEAEIATTQKFKRPGNREQRRRLGRLGGLSLADLEAYAAAANRGEIADPQIKARFVEAVVRPHEHGHALIFIMRKAKG